MGKAEKTLTNRKTKQFNDSVVTLGNRLKLSHKNNILNNSQKRAKCMPKVLKL